MSDKTFHLAFKQEANYFPPPTRVNCRNCGTRLKVYSIRQETPCMGVVPNVEEGRSNERRCRVMQTIETAMKWLGFGVKMIGLSAASAVLVALLLELLRRRK